MVLSWWMFLLAAAVLGMGSAFCAMLSLSLGTAYATEYHVLSPRQRVMARLLGVGSLATAVACGVAALASLFWGLRGLWLLSA
jgi:MFS family permease